MSVTAREYVYIPFPENNITQVLVTRDTEVVLMISSVWETKTLKYTHGGVSVVIFCLFA